MQTNYYAQAKGKTPFVLEGKHQYRAEFISNNGLFSHSETFRADDIREAQKKAKEFNRAYGCRLQSLSQK
ncbi:hypothetical protein [Vibrio harveyi]|uniref:hypothetical protein n=1 Tax=Vibrio harveyi TaxID=669 RepID=UPI003D736F5E